MNTSSTCIYGKHNIWAGYKLLKRAVKGLVKYIMRPLCNVCNEKPCAVNYYKNNKPFYRSKCDGCSRGTTVLKPKWYRLGYRKKDTCEKCGFKSKYPEQFNVFHIDGNLENCRPNNLKTVCANCQRILHREGARWRQGDLTPDL